MKEYKKGFEQILESEKKLDQARKQLVRLVHSTLSMYVLYYRQIMKRKRRNMKKSYPKVAKILK